MAKAASKAIEAEISVGEAAELIERTDRRVRQLVEEGFVPRPKRGRYRIVDVVLGHQRALAKEREAASVGAADEHLQRLRIQEVELRIEQRSKTLIEAARAEGLALVSEHAGALLADLQAVASHCTDDLALRRKIEDKINDAVGRAASRARAEAARGGAPGDVVEVATEDAPGRLGAGKPHLSKVKPAARRARA